MQSFSRTLLAASISTALYVSTTQAETITDSSVQEMPSIDQCLIEPAAENETQLPAHVESDRLEAINGDKAIYSGDVRVTQGNKTILADNVTLHQQENIVVAEGNVNFSDGQIKSISDRATNNLTTDEMTLENTDYEFLCEPGRGDAVYIAKTGKAVYEIEDGSITSCPIGDNAWRLRASSIDVDQNEEQATFYNPRFEIQSVPVFYLPYLTVPIGDTRKTGFLYPTVSYGSSDGFEAEIPVYWNLAPNYDLETTFKYMQERGTQLNSKFRYLSDFGSGSIKSEYLPDDKKFEEKGDRWGAQLQHSGIFQQSWLFEVDYSKVSDIDYFTDVSSSSIGNREDGQLLQEGQATYRSHNWDASVLVRDFQVLTTSNNLPYRLMPQLEYNYYAPEVMEYLDFDMVSHVSAFDTDAKGKPSATRVHIEPGITIPVGNTWGTWTTEARLLGTYYQQDLDGVDTGAGSDYEGLEESVSRVIPEFRSHAGIVLERDTTIVGNYTQTLEPQVQYLYVPEQDQSDIGLYDTTLLQTDYYGLFRSRKYSGVDRIASANQISYGASSRFFDDEYKERLNISFGQIFYIDKDTKQTLDNDDSGKKTNYSSWAIEMDFNYDDYLFYHGGVQYDIDTTAMQLANSTLEYRFAGGYIQTNYRYVTEEYINETVDFDVSSITRDGISQAGLLGSYQISPKWSTSAQYFYDLTTQEDLEWLARLNYRSDCWYIGFTYSNRLTNNISDPNTTPEYENNFSVNFGIVGFGTNIGSDSGAIGDSSSDNSLSYGRPFFLNN
ncbi:LPS assembly protein LptD [Vibrio sp. 10N.222.51.C8]|uniref:LPS assembly protein LptD n=1 Tax=unclassified Vibrio TaxID=2614977 RepID=UPI000C823AFA|nr:MULTISPECIES: LPS assembly protein LptD [unclassified Vibrio]TKF39885.1 LPS assembly protein LptD [Vibrio sp. F13]TKF53597.1 LPS assembly protein LptD [Vibrio sp. F13]TKF64862.1 LPS assembly protein LptD [Vibrio sp. F13]TKF74384.1 LPS assembly protein LptD [Vibrio sp. F13]TKG07611.1 LPS assembly protein LptD [Vibrio sp. F13]